MFLIQITANSYNRKLATKVTHLLPQTRSITSENSYSISQVDQFVCTPNITKSFKNDNV